jgi:hypothetical protein
VVSAPARHKEIPVASFSLQRNLPCYRCGDSGRGRGPRTTPSWLLENQATLNQISRSFFKNPKFDLLPTPHASCLLNHPICPRHHIRLVRPICLAVSMHRFPPVIGSPLPCNLTGKSLAPLRFWTCGEPFGCAQDSLRRAIAEFGLPNKGLSAMIACFCFITFLLITRLSRQLTFAST